MIKKHAEFEKDYKTWHYKLAKPASAWPQALISESLKQETNKQKKK